MDAQLDLSIAATIKDPALRASAERLGLAMHSTPPLEPSPSSSAKIIQFPLFPETARPVSNDMARSALFSCIQGKDRRFIKDALLAAVEGKEIRFTGEQLNQDDHDLLMQMVFMAQYKPLGSWVMAPAYGILQALGRQIGGKQYRELRGDIARLTASMVIIRNTKTMREVFGHHLIAKAEQDEKKSSLDLPARSRFACALRRNVAYLDRVGTAARAQGQRPGALVAAVYCQPCKALSG